jgi:hypothetical protein
VTMNDDHRMRLVSDDVPHVYPVADAVVMQMSPELALVLAGILSHYDVLTEIYPRVLDELLEVAPERVPGAQSIHRAEGYDAAVWHKTLVDLHTARARIDMRLVPLLQVGPKVQP